MTQPLAPAIPQRWPTRITELMGIRWPLLLGGMMWLSDARLVAAMVRAGGMGFMTARSSRTDQDFRQALRDCGELTGGLPFGVNLTLSRRAANNESMLTRLRIALDAGVRLFETAGLPPTPLLPALREAGAIVIHKCAHVRHAVAAQNMGVDAVALVGMEEGGHPGNNQLPTFLNGAYALEQLHIPLALGGGIGHGRQIAAALALGADAVVMGSVFTPAQETPAHVAYKQRVVDTNEHGTRAVLGSLGDTWRILDNENARKVAALEQAGANSYADFGELISGERTQALAYQAGQHEEGMLSMGPAVGFARGIEPVESIVLRLQRECVQASARFRHMLDSA
ncbi:NAD(P)H-dependent flavin oxidoreductase [Achromobacter aegrifaciens]|uniref:NAD(P)H-dependent flavin oxidoreductase n=1 Tax=Achromobacter aegrifaciens TaxID=1287736 RepID=UPI001466DBFA|nr:nitronate monooxygenase [Achromobacter aegrifaciens]CAB3629508.1 NADH:quinone reductase [Achromobacter aegrifaciens]